MNRSIIAYGETLWDLLPGGAVLGGAPYNLTYRLHSVGHAARLISRLGIDDLGRQAERIIRANRMDFSFFQWDSTWPTGTVQVKLDEEGVPDFYIVPEVAYDHIEILPGYPEAVSKADCFCYGTLVQRGSSSRMSLHALLETARQHRVPRLCDLNLRKNCYSKATLQASLEFADLLKLNEDEAHHLAAEWNLPAGDLLTLAQALVAKWQLQVCVITLGPNGVLCVDARNRSVHEPGFQVPVVDTCGSGDAFTAGFLHGWLSGLPAQDSCRQGNALGALVAGQAGATEAIAWSRVEDFLRQKHERLVHPSLTALAPRAAPETDSSWLGPV